MAGATSATTFDIHGGGIDLRFPHHENEQAQSQAAGWGFARYWLHNGWVTTGGEKMSKSLGNSLLVTAVLERVRPLALRYYLGAAHYRSNIEYHEDSLREASHGVGRIEGFMTRAAQRLSAGDGRLDRLRARRVPADFGPGDGRRPQRLGRAGRRARHRARRQHRARAPATTTASASALGAVSGMTYVLGINPHEPAVVGRHGRRRPGGPTRSTPSCALSSTRAPRPGPPRTSPRPTPSATGSPRAGRRGDGRRHATVTELGHGTPSEPKEAWHDGRQLPAPGSRAQERVEEGPTAGSGGQDPARRSRAGVRRPRPRTASTTSAHKARRPPRSTQPSPAPRPAGAGSRRATVPWQASASTEFVAGRNSVVEALRADIPADRAVHRVAASTPTTG